MQTKPGLWYGESVITDSLRKTGYVNAENVKFGGGNWNTIFTETKPMGRRTPRRHPCETITGHLVQGIGKLMKSSSLFECVCLVC